MWVPCDSGAASKYIFSYARNADKVDSLCIPHGGVVVGM